jgi:HK97 family phage portal protein
VNFDLTSDGTTTTRAAPEERLIGEEYIWTTPPTSAGMYVTSRTALESTALLATFNVIATDVAMLPLDVYQRLPGGGRRNAVEHSNDEILTRSPDGETTPTRWRQALMGHALAFGNGYAEIERVGRGRPYKLHLLDPETTHVERREDRLGYRLADGKWLESANVLHVAGLGFDGLCGYNFVRLIRQAIGLGAAAESYGADYFANGAEPNGYIKTPMPLNPKAKAELREGWFDVHGGAGKRHKTGVLSGGSEWVSTSSDPEKTQLVEVRKFQLNDVVRPWRVPPHKVGDFSQAHLANIEASNLDYLTTALMPWLKAIEQEFTFKLFSRAEWQMGYYVEHNVNALLRGDIASRFSAYEIATRNGWMSRDEVRQRENDNPMGEAKGGSIYTVQSQNIPLDQVGKTPVEPAPAGGNADGT